MRAYLFQRHLVVNVTITNDAYVTAQSVCELLEKFAALYVDIPNAIFLDNARYQKCALVVEKAQGLNIELCFLPTYSPNLNLIERVWKERNACIPNITKNCLLSKQAILSASKKA